MAYQRITLMRSLTIVLLAIALAAACKPDTRQPQATAPRGDLHLGLIWPDKDGTLTPQLAIGTDGTLYVMDKKGALHAVTPTGQERWTYQPEAELAGAPVMSSDGTSVYFLTGNDELISVGTDGKLRWTFKAADPFTAAPVVAHDGTIYLHTRSGGQRVSPDGKGQAFTWPEYTDRSEVAFDSRGQLSLFDPMKKQLLVLSSDGQVTHHCEENTPLSFGPLIGKKDAAFYTLSDGTLVARDTACKELWRSSLGTSPDRGANYPLVLGAESVVYASGPDGRVQAIDAENGQLVWASEPITTTGALVYLIAGKDGMLYALSDQAKLLGIRDGKQVWSQQLIEPNLPSLPVTTPDGGLAFVQAGQLYQFTYDAALTRALPTPVPMPTDKAGAEKEITNFLVDFIVQQEIGGTADYVRNSGQPWVSAPPQANLIVWAPALEKSDTFNFLQSDKPTRVWWYADGKLTETEDKLKSIEEYRQRYMKEAKSDIWAWGYYEFGVVSIADDKQSARVYVGASCGPLCGHGYYYTLRRSPSGKWWITDAEHLWQS